MTNRTRHDQSSVDFNCGARIAVLSSLFLHYQRDRAVDTPTKTILLPSRRPPGLSQSLAEPEHELPRPTGGDGS
ncbi:hypothetical protein Poly59_19990 [Rubripirellula reticaptiva]|uniref:Uncharacterized protein n=1 Tax=Rubripirellula reticaptiva TaxID=2528013 RepID=A0A5C6F7E8_9BACT|nr:hypothetical protein Poly59_19990 [Rubripirellula reticaptiva]